MPSEMEQRDTNNLLYNIKNGYPDQYFRHHKIKFFSMEYNVSDNLRNPDLRDTLNELALDMATNYCTVSFGENEKEQVKLKDIFKVDSSLYTQLISSRFKDKKVNINEAGVVNITQHRNILVIGAGATYDSYKCIPLGLQVIESFKDKYQGKIDDFPAIKEKYDTYLKEYVLQEREPDFENMLSLYSELILTADELRHEISEFFNFRYSPSLFYELIAHLFKHSFIDVIINFNFDEILDQAIEEELGKENYFHIISDGDCVSMEEMMVDGRLKIPIYIKPHGTVSHKSTLRFTKRHYLDVPEKIKLLLEELIKGERGEIIGRKKEEIGNIHRVNLISVGFNMESLEFGDILNKHLPEESRIYHFCYEKNYKSKDPHFMIAKVLPVFYENAVAYHIKNGVTDMKKIDELIYKRIAIEDFNTTSEKNQLTTPYAEVFSYIWRRIHGVLRDDLLPRSIARHEINNYLFYSPEIFMYYDKSKVKEKRESLRNRYEVEIDYFLDKTIVEIAISINRNNGIVEIAQLLGDRAGTYYKKYRDTYFKKNKTDKGAFSIYDLINEFGDEKSVKDPGIYYFKNIFELKIEVLGRVKDDLKKDANVVHRRLQKWIIRTYKNETDKPVIEKNEQLFNKMIEIFKTHLYSDDFDRVSLTLLYRLFTSKIISKQFIDNLKANYCKKVYNGKENEPSITMLEELTRLFNKSTRRHYFSIRPKFNDPQNYVSENFSKRRILHTNLSLDYTFRKLFQGIDWDIALIISETGSYMDFMSIDKEQRGFKNKKIIMINAYEAIKHLSEPGKTIPELNEAQNEKYKALMDRFPGDNNNHIRTFSIPSIQHNHHMMLFIKKADNPSFPLYSANGKNATISFNMMGALYMYRQGFSTNINPLLIGMFPYNSADENLVTLNHDFKKLLRIFFTNFNRAVNFEGIKGIEDLEINFKDYLQWSAEDDKINIDRFLQYVQQSDGLNFKPAE